MILKVGRSGGGKAAVTYPLGARDAEGRKREIQPRVLIGDPAFLLASVVASGRTSACTSIILAEPGDVPDGKLRRTIARFLHMIFGGLEPTEFQFVAYVHKKLRAHSPPPLASRKLG